MSKKVIAVCGATGLQGGGVVEDLLNRETFAVRALTRNPQSEKGQALKARGCEVVAADFAKPETLLAALQGAHGAFAVTNFWESMQRAVEFEQGKALAHAAREAGVQHYVWSTLPNCEAISGGKYKVEHFSGKADVNAVVSAAGFAQHTFVEPPMYFQNFLTMMAPQPQKDGSKAWFMPMKADNRCIHMGDVTEFGKLASRAFEAPEKYGSGQHLAQAAGLYSWQYLVDALNEQGHNVKYHQMPNEAFDALPFPGAAELREMMNYFEDYTYFGPEGEAHVALGNEAVPEGFTAFADWAKANLKP